MGAQVIQFPVADRMPTRVAEERIGSLINYRYPPVSKNIPDLWEWLDRWLRKKSIVIGWVPINQGLVYAFKGGRVAHLVCDVYPVDVDSGERPKIEVACSGVLYSVFNWDSRRPVTANPAVVLGADQEPYFKVCQKCEAAMRRRGM